MNPFTKNATKTTFIAKIACQSLVCLNKPSIEEIIASDLIEQAEVGSCSIQ